MYYGDCCVTWSDDEILNYLKCSLKIILKEMIFPQTKTLDHIGEEFDNTQVIFWGCKYLPHYDSGIKRSVDE